MVRITQNKTRKYVSLGLSYHPSLWDSQKHQPRKNHPKKKLLEAIIAKKVASYHTKFLEIVAEDKAVSPEALVKAVESPSTARQVFPFFDELIERLIKSGKIGNANVYKDTRRTLKQYVSHAGLLFTDIDQRFLNKYEAFLSNRGLSDTSLSVYFRTLRAVFSKAIKEQLVKAEYSPFRDFNVSKFNTTTKKRATTKEEIKKLAQLPIAPSSHLYEPNNISYSATTGKALTLETLLF